jgi:hypothetical protein
MRKRFEYLSGWQAYPWEEEAEWGEFSYRPSKWPRSYRVIVKRTPFFEGNQRVLGTYFYTAVITNRCGVGSSLLKHHLARGGIENYIEKFKNGLGARLLPTQRFVANWAWLVIAQLANNLGQWFKLLLLPMREQSYQFKALRLHLLFVTGRLIRGGWQLTLAT